MGVLAARPGLAPPQPGRGCSGALAGGAPNSRARLRQPSPSPLRGATHTGAQRALLLQAHGPRQALALAAGLQDRRRPAGREAAAREALRMRAASHAQASTSAAAQAAEADPPTAAQAAVVAHALAAAHSGARGAPDAGTPAAAPGEAGQHAAQRAGSGVGDAAAAGESSGRALDTAMRELRALVAAQQAAISQLQAVAGEPARLQAAAAGDPALLQAAAGDPARLHAGGAHGAAAPRNGFVRPYDAQRAAISDRRHLGMYDARFHSTHWRAALSLHRAGLGLRACTLRGSTPCTGAPR